MNFFNEEDVLNFGIDNDEKQKNDNMHEFEKLKQDEEKIQFGEKLTYESSYADEPDNGKYLTTIETIKT